MAEHLDLGLAMASAWYPRYATELRQLREVGSIANFCARERHCLTGTIDAELTYMRLRETKPKIVWEISPSHGFSTLVMLHALWRNEQETGRNATLFSFDVDGISSARLKQMRPFAHLMPQWRLVVGDVRERLFQRRSTASEAVGRPRKLRHLYGLPDYVHLDSQHSAEFGHFYVEKLLPSVSARRHCYVALHDVYHPTLWTDAMERNTTINPSFMPTLEGGVVLEWLAFGARASCNLFTLSWYKSSNAPFAEAAARVRAKAGVVNPFFRGVPDVNDADASRRLMQNSVMIFFELGCRQQQRTAAGRSREEASMRPHARNAA